MLRQVAVKVRVQDMLSSAYKKGTEDIPNQIVLADGRVVGRVNVLATVVSVDAQSFVVDDGSGSITVRLFDEQTSIPTIGQLVLLIGKPREFGGEHYILPEIIKPVRDPVWMQVRNNELPKSVQVVATAEPKVHEEIIGEPKLVSVVRSLDKGDGADYEEVIAQSGDENAETEISKLITQGSLFIPKAGRLKAVD